MASDTRKLMTDIVLGPDNPSKDEVRLRMPPQSKDVEEWLNFFFPVGGARTRSRGQMKSPPLGIIDGRFKKRSTARTHTSADVVTPFDIHRQ
jgi:hypothetical protein